MSGVKEIVNKTGYPLSIDLVVRRGDDPSNTLKTVSVSLDSGETKRVQYGDDHNPYLNGMDVNAVSGGSFLAQQQFVFKRGNELDDEFNKNDTLTFTMSGTSFVLDFSNTWTV